MKKIRFDKAFINSIPKMVNDNGCWIPSYTPKKDGYVRIQIQGVKYFLHRLSLCAFYNLDYYSEIETRHNQFCSHSCFNPDHLKPGTRSDNTKDMILHGNHNEVRKEVCPKCGGDFVKIVTRSGPNKGRTWRGCPSCRRKGNRERYHRLKKLTLRASTNQ